jgi:hypothetical protein
MAVGDPKKRRTRAAPARAAAEATAPSAVSAEARKRRFRITEAGVALIALLVSGTSFLINGAFFLRGSEMVILPPENWLLYRDGGPHGADLYLAMPLNVVNAAGADFGDVVVRAEVQIFSGRKAPGVFPYSGLVEPVLTPQVEAGVANCPQGARCIANTGFYVIERPAKLLDVPGGGSRSEFLTFLLSPNNCLGSEQYCASFNQFDNAVAALRREPEPVIRVVVRYQFDGDHTVECRLTKDAQLRGKILDYLQDKGWTMQPCVLAQAQRPMGLPPSLSQ